jgi:hypothetical protein
MNPFFDSDPLTLIPTHNTIYSSYFDSIPDSLAPLSLLTSGGLGTAATSEFLV